MQYNLLSQITQPLHKEHRFKTMAYQHAIQH
jgi:hypothetical protein